MEYLRPKTIEEALQLLAQGTPLGGGTRINPERSKLTKVIDLQSLDLDGMQAIDGRIVIGAMARLQAILTTDLPIPEALRKACRHEAGLNIRNQATLGGALMGADGRSPLLTALAALAPGILLAPDDQVIDIERLFVRRKQQARDFILLSLSFMKPACVAYEFVARAPTDLPIVSAAAAAFKDGPDPFLRISLGGHGDHPQSWVERLAGDDQPLLDSVSVAARQVYSNAGDAFASAEYRAEAAAVLARRVVNEVLEAC